MQIGYERRGTAMLVGGLFAFSAFAWAEIQRRLVNLNGEAERIKAAQSASVSSDTYQANERQRQTERLTLDARLGKYDENFTRTLSREDLARETRGDRVATRDSNANWLRAGAALIAVMLSLLTYATLHYRAPAAPTQTVTTTTTVTIP